MIFSKYYLNLTHLAICHKIPLEKGTGNAAVSQLICPDGQKDLYRLQQGKEILLIIVIIALLLRLSWWWMYGRGPFFPYRSLHDIGVFVDVVVAAVVVVEMT